MGVLGRYFTLKDQPCWHPAKAQGGNAETMPDHADRTHAAHSYIAVDGGRKMCLTPLLEPW